MRYFNDTAWKSYYRKVAIEAASLTASIKEEDETNKNALHYGDEVYSSPVVSVNAKSVEKAELENDGMRWEVTEFEGKFNVFNVQRMGKKVTRHFAASFLSIEAAKKFALEMLLVCTKKLNRHGLIESTK